MGYLKKIKPGLDSVFYSGNGFKNKAGYKVVFSSDYKNKGLENITVKGI